MSPERDLRHLVHEPVTGIGTVDRSERRARPVQAKVSTRCRQDSGLISSGNSMVRFSTAPSASTATSTATCEASRDDLHRAHRRRVVACGRRRQTRGRSARQEAGSCARAFLDLAVDLRVEGAHLLCSGPGRERPVGRGGRRSTGSPCRSGYGPQRYAAGAGSPRARGRTSRF